VKTNQAIIIDIANSLITAAVGLLAIGVKAKRFSNLTKKHVSHHSMCHDIVVDGLSLLLFINDHRRLYHSKLLNAFIKFLLQNKIAYK
jgi:hypothetical protein